MTSLLDVYFHEYLVGKLTQDSAGTMEFQYDEEFLAAKSSLIPPISLSMPFQEEPYEGAKVRAFFSGLLPDDSVRMRLAQYLGISEKNSFKLLEAVGGECAGALSLYPPGLSPSLAPESDLEILDSHQLKKVLELLKSRPLLAGQNQMRLSLAGAQDKIAVCMVEDHIALAQGSKPTSHILKPMIPGVEGSIYNELFCLRLARAVGIEVPSCKIRWARETPYFLIERYDRQKKEGGELLRLHQEDFCQALGILPEFKYEREGGPSLSQSLLLLETHSLQPAADCLSLIQRVIFNYLIGNADAHGKNFSLLYKNFQPTLAPAYDLLCTAIYPHLSSKMAMKIGGHYDPSSVFLRHWHQLVPSTVGARKSLEKTIKSLATACRHEAELLQRRLLREGSTSPVIKKIREVLEKRTSRLLSEF